MDFSTQQLQNIVAQILVKSVTRKLGLCVRRQTRRLPQFPREGGRTPPNQGKQAAFETTNEEDAFFKELVKQTMEAELNPLLFYYEPMSNKSFSIQYNRYPIGKIKLKGRTTYMQILEGLTDVEEICNSSLEEYISHIPKWIKHIKFCLID